MASKKTTRRALFSSVIALILCMAMLVGTTFAWFTDEVVSGNNLITAGNLDVELYHSDKAAPNGEKVNEKTVLFDDVTLWEPGAVAYENFVVKNEGNLALKYQMNLNFDNATDNGSGGTLADVLKVAVVEGGFTGGRAEAQGLTYGYDLSTFTLSGALSAQESSRTYGVVIYWQPSDNDNAYNMNNEHTEVLSIDLGVHLYATQKEHEFDSFGPEYDNEATVYASYAFDSEADLLAFASVAGDAASSGLSLTEDGKAQIDKSGAWYPVDVDLAANGYSIEYDLDITGLAVGQNVTVDTGESGNWGSTPIMLERGSTIVYYGTHKNERIGTLDGTKLHITHEYTLDADGKLNIKTTVSDGATSLTYSKAVASNAKTSLYWDIYTVSEAGKATMDNFTFSSVVDGDVVATKKGEKAVELSFADFCASVNEGNDYSGWTITLKDDIDFGGAELTPIGLAVGQNLTAEGSAPFSGMFDGNGHTLSNFKVTQGVTVDGDPWLSLFTAIYAKDGNTAGVKNLTLSNVTYDNPNGTIGAIVNVADSDGKSALEFSDINISGTIRGFGYYGDAGIATLMFGDEVTVSNIELDLDFIIPADFTVAGYKFISPCVGQISLKENGHITFTNVDWDDCAFYYPSTFRLEDRSTVIDGYNSIWVYNTLAGTRVLGCGGYSGQFYNDGVTYTIDGVNYTHADLLKGQKDVPGYMYDYIIRPTEFTAYDVE